MEEKVTMRTFIEETPQQVLDNTVHAKEMTQTLVDLFMKKDYQAIWIIASGSSSNAAQCAKPLMMKYLNCDVKIVPPNSFVYLENKLNDNDFVFVISQSGCSTNAIEALKTLKKLGVQAIGLTGNINSDFQKYADILIDFHVGIETVGYVTKGVVTLAQFLMLFALESSLLKDFITDKQYHEVMNELYEVPQRHKIMQEETWDFYQRHQKDMTSMNVIHICGFMQGYGIATEGALKIGETVKIPSVAYEAEEYIHGPNLQLTPNYTVWCIDDCSVGSERLIQIYQAVKSVTDQAYAITNNSIVDDEHAIRLPFEIKEPLLSPLYVLPVFQIIAYQTSQELHTWQGHPMFKNFKTIVKTKTDRIKTIMKD